MEKNIDIVWIDYKKAYMVQRSRIIDSLKMYKISKVIRFIENTMENWRVELTAGGKSLTKVKIWRGIFQENVLSPLTICNSHDATQSHT